MNNELQQAYQNLSLNDKRNALSNEIIIISELINNINQKLNIPHQVQVRNYDVNQDINLSENDLLTYTYEDIYNIKRELLSIFNNLD